LFLSLRHVSERSCFGRYRSEIWTGHSFCYVLNGDTLVTRRTVVYNPKPEDAIPPRASPRFCAILHLIPKSTSLLDFHSMAAQIDDMISCITLTPGREEPLPATGDHVHLDFVISSANGSKSWASTTPFVLRIGASPSAIPAIELMAPRMTTGSRIEMVVPPKLGYGERGYPPIVPPNSPVRIVLTLVDITRAKRS